MCTHWIPQLAQFSQLSSLMVMLLPVFELRFIATFEFNPGCMSFLDLFPEEDSEVS